MHFRKQENEILLFYFCVCLNWKALPRLKLSSCSDHICMYGFWRHNNNKWIPGLFFSKFKHLKVKNLAFFHLFWPLISLEKQYYRLRSTLLWCQRSLRPMLRPLMDERLQHTTNFPKVSSATRQSSFYRTCCVGDGSLTSSSCQMFKWVE